MYEHTPSQRLPERLEELSRRAGFIDRQPPTISHQMQTETRRTVAKCKHVLAEVPKARAAATTALVRLQWLELQD
jgi:hypothetical protein